MNESKRVVTTLKVCLLASVLLLSVQSQTAWGWVPETHRAYALYSLQDTTQGQALLKRKNAEDLKTWIAEGAKFDGKDAKGNLREMVPTDEEKRMAELANMSPDEFAKLRRDTLEPTWKRVVNNDPAEMLETDDFIFYGNVSADRLKEISGWATTQVEDLRKLFNEKQKPFWKGKLAVYVVVHVAYIFGSGNVWCIA